MAKRRTATLAEKEIIDRLAHAIVIEDIAKKCMEEKHPQHAASYRHHMRKNCPEFYRLFDELGKAIPRIQKEMAAQIEKQDWSSDMPKVTK